MKTIRETFEERIQILLPGMKILSKRDSRWYRFLAWVLKPFIPDYMDRFSSAGLDGNIYLDDKSWNKPDINILPILAHEAVHLYDRKKAGFFLYQFAYWFPQVLSVFALLAFLSPWFLLALVFLTPLPAPFRANIEQDGYSMQLFTYVKLRPDVDVTTYIDSVVDMFFDRSYYFMWPFNRKGLRLAFLLNSRRLNIDHPMFRFVNEFIDEINS